jgi:eukaryotic-like serine/threonine-protein kinase
VLLGLLTKDPAARTTAAEARRELDAVAAGPEDPAAPRRSAAAPRGGDVERFDLADLRALASTSKAVLGTVAREVRGHARELSDRRHGPPLTRRERRAAAKQRRFRFKRRWVVVPLVVLVLVVILVVAALTLIVTGVITFN